MHSSYKLLAAGVLASVTAGERLSTMLAQTQAESVTHPCVAGADCLDYKVSDALQSIIDQVDLGTDIAQDGGIIVRDELLAGIRGLRFELTDAVNERADALINALSDELRATLDQLAAALAARLENVDDATDAVAKRMRDIEDEALDEVKPVLGITKQGDTRPSYQYAAPTYGSSVSSRRGRFFAQQSSGVTYPSNAAVYGPPPTFPFSTRNQVASAIDIARFETEEEAGNVFGDYLTENFYAFLDEIDAARSEYTAFKDGLLAEYRETIEEENHAWTHHRDWEQEKLQSWINDRMAEIDAHIASLKGNFIEDFMAALLDIHSQASNYQRVLLTAKANEKRADFFKAIADLRSELASGFRDTVTDFVRSVAAERVALGRARVAAALRIAESDVLLEDTWYSAVFADGGYENALHDKNAEASEWFQSRWSHQTHDFAQFISGINGYQYHWAFTGEDKAVTKQIYGYAGHDQNTVNVLGGYIGAFNDDIQGEYNAFQDATVEDLDAAKQNIVDIATDANTSAIDFLSDTLDLLIERITFERETREIELTATLEASMDDQTEAREAIEQGLADLKADILAELQKLKDWLFGYHGVSTIATGKLWDRVRELTNDWELAKEGAFIEFSTMQADAKEAWEKAAGSADLDCHDSLARKTADFEAAAFEAGERWAAAERTAVVDFEDAVEEAVASIEEAYAAKTRALELRYNALSANVNNVYDFHVYGNLQGALDDAKDNADAECKAKLAEFRSDVFDITDCFEGDMSEQVIRHSDAQDDNAAQCEQAKLDAATEWFEFSDELRGEFSEFQVLEAAAFGSSVRVLDAAYNKGIKAIKRLPLRNWWR